MGILLASLISKDKTNVIELYEVFAKLMNITTGGDMLNFGYWTDHHTKPIEAQRKLTEVISIYGEFHKASRIIDVGSGLSGPAFYWNNTFPLVEIFCIDINYQQLKSAKKTNSSNHLVSISLKNKPQGDKKVDKLHQINSTFGNLPFKDKSFDRVVAFESAQHFKPLSNFINEANRILTKSGILVMSIPIIKYNRFPIRRLSDLFRLGVLSFTWISEYYSLDHIKSLFNQTDLKVESVSLIGNKVYVPLANYYILNREKIRNEINNMYPPLFEKTIYLSILKMKNSYKNGKIDYVLLKARKIH